MNIQERQAATAAVEAFRLQNHSVSAAHKSHYVVGALGREFIVSDEMAQIFLRQVERVLEVDESALVVLRHRDGVELLLITDDNSFTIRPVRMPLD
ncbi:hypothetical protein ACPPVQ_01780 [Diaminobutyricibacter sp. McL0618]|uniref:hypothetical protein n=1 Tax=Leifsonia sp. McL0618 TaxID=3415677 RepID=UPI003CE7096A